MVPMTDRFQAMKDNPLKTFEDIDRYAADLVRLLSGLTNVLHDSGVRLNYNLRHSGLFQCREVYDAWKQVAAAASTAAWFRGAFRAEWRDVLTSLEPVHGPGDAYKKMRAERDAQLLAASPAFDFADQP